jgi:hypothetical protein
MIVLDDPVHSALCVITWWTLTSARSLMVAGGVVSNLAHGGHVSLSSQRRV